MTKVRIEEQKLVKAYKRQIVENNGGSQPGRVGSQNVRTDAPIDRMVSWKWAARWRELLPLAVAD